MKPINMKMKRICLRLEKDQVDKIPSLKNIKLGEPITLTASGTITRVRIEEKSHSVEIQITAGI